MQFKIILLFNVLFTFNLLAGIGEGQSASGPLPVELTSFSATVKSTSTGSATNVVLLNWTTATEVNNYGFEVQRASFREDGTTPVQGDWSTLGFVAGHGNSNSPKEYSFVDTDIKVAERSRSYRLKQIDTDGKFEYSDVIELKNNLTKEYVLEQNYPNPFNPTTVISYSIPTASHVIVKVYDVLGKTITTLVDKSQETGSYKVIFNATELSNGIYFYKINAGEFISIKKMLLLK
ncbi:MAG: T9SS type A sorting domain-containing protein [Melioribacteraceae bacterium]|nr:T9SS type A sorting domain-containing protein [Melioribacteraceae bacterium]